MNVLNGYGQHRKLIDVPCQVEYSFVLVDGHSIIVFAVCVAQLHCQSVVGSNGLLHVVQTAVAGNGDGTLGMERQFVKAGHLAYRYRHMQ